MLKLKQHKTFGIVLTALLVAPSLAFGADQADEMVKPATFEQLQRLNNQISILEAENQVAEQELKLIRNKNLINEAKGISTEPISSVETNPKAPVPQTVLIVGAGKNLRARMKFANGTSDDVWVGKRLPGDYVVASITSERVLLRDSGGKTVVAGVAGPDITPPAQTNNTPMGMPGPYPGGSPMTSSSRPMFPSPGSGPISLGN